MFGWDDYNAEYLAGLDVTVGDVSDVDFLLALGTESMWPHTPLLAAMVTARLQFTVENTPRHHDVGRHCAGGHQDYGRARPVQGRAGRRGGEGCVTWTL